VRKITLSSFVIGLLFATSLEAKGHSNQNVVQKTYSDNEVIVMLKEGAQSSLFLNKLDSSLSQRGGHKAQHLSHIGAVHIESDTQSTEELLSLLKSPEFAPYIQSVTPNNIMQLSDATNDSSYDQLWAIENQGQSVNGTSGTVDADMDVVEAWEKTTGDKSVVIAVLDTGVDYTHDDLKENMWSGAVNHGYDFAGDDDGNNDDDPMPDLPYDDNGHFHGTHVAGTIGAVANNALGVAGVAQDVSIMALKVFRPNGAGYTSDILEALDYVSEKIDEGENIVAINASYGGTGGEQDDAINAAIKSLGDKGVIFCAAAGNEGSNNDETPIYPASYDAENIVAVAASDQNDLLASFSNYGATSVDVAAPGVNILSTYPDNQYAYLSGTSMATPNVVGSVALIASLYPNSSVAERKAMLLDGVDVKEALSGKVATSGRVNVNEALGEPEESNTAPVANNDSVETEFETAVSIAVLANDMDEDNDTLSIVSFSTPSNGTVAQSDDLLIYTPNDGFSGEDSFEYTITDGEDSATATVSILVQESTVADDEEKEDDDALEKDDGEDEVIDDGTTDGEDEAIDDGTTDDQDEVIDDGEDEDEVIDDGDDEEDEVIDDDTDEKKNEQGFRGFQHQNRFGSVRGFGRRGA